MNILTKISAVVLVLLVIFAAPVFITLATVRPNYRDLYNKEQERTAIYQQSSTTERLRSDELARQLTAALTSASESQNKLSEARNEAAAAAVKAKQDLTAEQGRVASLGADVSRLSTVVKSDGERIEAMTTAMNKLREDFITSNKERLDALDQLNKKQAEADRAALALGVIQGTVASLSKENQQLREQLANMPAQKGPGAPGAAPPVAPANGIVGHINEIQKDVAGINVGSASGVKPGMKMMIYRGATFIGHMVIEEVDLNHSVGIITEKASDPMQGDKVSLVQD